MGRDLGKTCEDFRADLVGEAEAIGPEGPCMLEPCNDQGRILPSAKAGHKGCNAASGKAQKESLEGTGPCDVVATGILPSLQCAIVQESVAHGPVPRGHAPEAWPHMRDDDRTPAPHIVTPIVP